MQYLGKNFKAYGYQEPIASTGTNSINAITNGPFYIEYQDGTKHNVSSCKITLAGTLLGDRTYTAYDRFYITDEKNDLLVYIEFNPDDRSTFSKLFTSKKTFPDFYT